MNLKHFTLLTALAALLLCTSCAKDDDMLAGTVPVTFIAHLPETIDSRAIGDGTKANELFFWVYDENGHEYTELRQKNLDFDQTNTSRVTAHLIPGHTYKFAFWAQAIGSEAYDPDNSNIVQLYYDGAKCNDELRDAFYGWIPNLTVSAEGNVTQDIILTRHLAQLNVGLSLDGYEAAKAAGFDLEDYESEIVVSNGTAAAYTGFDLTTGGPVLSDWQYQTPEVWFEFAPHPTEHLNAEEKEWEYLALNYFLPLYTDYTLVTVQMTLRHKEDPTKVIGPLSWSNIKVKGHERTNILLTSITEPTRFRIVVDENFDNVDYNINLDEQQVQTADELKSAIAAGENVKLENDITMTEGTSLTIPQGTEMSLNLNGHTLTNSVSGAPALINQGTLTLKGGTIFNNNQDAQGADAIRNEGGSLTIESGTYGSDNNRGAAVRNNGGTVTINGGTFATIDRGLDHGWAYVFINNAADATMVINNATSDCDPNGMFAANAGTMTINGGTYTMGDPSKNTYYMFYAADGVINVNGGTFNWTHGLYSNVYQYLDPDCSGAINIASEVTINATYK